MKVTSKVVLYKRAVAKLTGAQITALDQTAESLLERVRDAQVIPRDSGHLQGDATTVDRTNLKNGTASIVSQTPYARRLYFHPEYNFQTKDNPNAQGKWFEPWISGSEKDFCKNVYEIHFKRLGGV